MMDVDPDTRISAKDALDHPYFSSFKPIHKSNSVPKPKFLEPSVCDWTPRHPELNKKMRPKLVEWLKEVTKHFESSVDTYSQCIEMIDAFMSKTTTQIPKQRLQLVGVAAMLISSSMNDLVCVDIEDMLWVSKLAYTKEELVEMAWNIFNCIEHLMPPPRSTPEVVEKDYLESLTDACNKHCSTFLPTIQV
jgi:hypothetical protein